jgi:polyphosphate glucokinase
MPGVSRVAMPTLQLYIGGREAKKITFELPPNVKIVPNINGLLGGIALWRD